MAAVAGLELILGSSDLFLGLSRFTGIRLFADIFFNNYLFIRLGDVLLVFAVFMLLRGWMQNRSVLKIGQSTLSIYVVHFIILYGSFTGLGLYRFLQHSLSPALAVSGALAFMVVCTYTALQYEKHKVSIKLKLATTGKYALVRSEAIAMNGLEFIKDQFYRLLQRFGLVKN
jgi:hypothetical protein